KIISKRISTLIPSGPGRQRLVTEASPDANCLDGFEHVVDADELRSLLHRFHRKGDASAEALVGWSFTRKRADCALAAGADDERVPKRVEKREAIHQLEVVADVLAEAEARIDEDMLALYARLDRGLDPLLQPKIDLDQHVVVPRVVLHGLRIALVMHQHDRDIQRRG